MPPANLERFTQAIASRYRIERELGAGGMATVYLAHDLRHDRPVALKLLRPELEAALGAERFEREIRLAARLQHPHVLTVLDSGETEGRLWFTMPYVEGESLRARLGRERQLSVRDALRITREAGQALQYAHDHGVVHRDIKPDNILLTKDGSTLVADFGIARALDANTGGLTQTGMSLGTPAYMSPEQASGEREIDGRTDVYALGTVLYEMLAGEAPFTGPTVQAVIARRFSQPPPSVRAMRPNVPEGVDRAIQRALAVVPGDRFPGMAAFIDALEVNDTSPTVVTGSAAPALARPRRIPLTAALATGLVIGAGVLFAWKRGSTAASPAASSSAAAPSTARIAVLPFENLGDTSDAYFADGVTDAVRGKLTSLPALQVIARGSSQQYKGSTRAPGEIADELGVKYLLTGTVRWARGKDGSSRVLVSPELVEIMPDGRASSRWQQPFDAPLNDVFKVQADIATRVTEAMQVALPGSVRAAINKVPTSNTGAYDEFLRGDAAWGAGANTAPRALRDAARHYEAAVKLDPAFAEAWAKLSTVNSFLYTNSVPTRQVAEAARSAFKQALALDPDGVQTHLAKMRVLSQVELDPDAAAAEMRVALAATPNDASLLGAMASTQQSAGNFDEALRLGLAARALDPRTPTRSAQLASTLLWMRQTDSAIPFIERGVALAPGAPAYVQRRILAFLQKGDVASARRYLAAQTGVDRTEMAVYMCAVWDLCWVLGEEDQQLVLAADSSAFDDDPSSVYLIRTQLDAWRGDTAGARLWGQRAADILKVQQQDAPEEPQRHFLRALALAHAGRKAEALKSLDAGGAIAARINDQYTGPYYEYLTVRTLVYLGEYERALTLLEKIMKAPFFVTPAWLRVDPDVAPLRGNPRFERLLTP